MEHLDGIVKLAENEFAAIVQNGKFRSREEIDSVYKLMDIVKDRMEIECMEYDMDGESYGDGMSYERDGRDGRSYRGGSYEGSYEGGSYARGRGRNARRDSMGRYSREGSYRDGGYRGNSYERGYSRDGKEEYKQQLREMMEDAPDEQTRQSIKRMIDNMQ